MKVSIISTNKYQALREVDGNWFFTFSPHPLGDGSWRVLTEKVVGHRPDISEIKEILLETLEEFDKGPYVNSFSLHGSKGWLGKDQRGALRETIKILRELGESRITLWISGKPLGVELQEAESFLRDLEIYSMKCFQVTQKHYQDIKNLRTKEELLEYDLQEGYPENIIINGR